MSGVEGKIFHPPIKRLGKASWPKVARGVCVWKTSSPPKEAHNPWQLAEAETSLREGGEATAWNRDFSGSDHCFRNLLANPQLDLSAASHPDLISGLGPSGSASIPTQNPRVPQSIVKGPTADCEQMNNQSWDKWEINCEITFWNTTKISNSPSKYCENFCPAIGNTGVISTYYTNCQLVCVVLLQSHLTGEARVIKRKKSTWQTFFLKLVSESAGQILRIPFACWLLPRTLFLIFLRSLCYSIIWEICSSI